MKTIENIDVLDYFAAHAPENIPPWFQPIPLILPEQPQNAEWCEGCKADSDCDKTPACIAMQSHRTAVAEARRINKQRNYIHWRWTYALLMVKASDSPMLK